MSQLPIPLYVPNILCYIRIILSFISIRTASSESSTTSDNDAFRLICITSTLWIVASILDHIDGKVARYFNQCSQFGVFLDIIADNVLRGSAWMCVVVAASTINNRDRSIDQNVGSVTSENRDTISLLAPMLGLFFISVEWMTMISSQMLTLVKEKRHWKDVGQHTNHEHNIVEEQEMERFCRGEASKMELEGTSLQDSKHVSVPSAKQPPRFVQAVFANNFCNFFGILAMYGLFSVGMIQYLFLHRSIIFQHMPILKIPLHLALITSYIGRMLALCTEMWLCYEFAKNLLEDEQITKKNSV